MTIDHREALLARYAAGFDEVARALEGLEPKDLTAHPIPGQIRRLREAIAP